MTLKKTKMRAVALDLQLRKHHKRHRKGVECPVRNREAQMVRVERVGEILRISDPTGDSVHLTLDRAQKLQTVLNAWIGKKGWKL